MKELIPVNQATIGSETVQAVNARELHAFLGSKQDFSTWIKKRIADYGFVASQDFEIIAPQKNGALKSITYGQEAIEYAITLDMAKELSMVERNARGKEARQYFIACEKKLKEILNKQIHEFSRKQHRDTARIEYRPMTDALQEERQKLGKSTNWFHYANEADLLNRIALGMTAAEFKAFHNIGNGNLRDYLTELQVKCIADLQRANTVFLNMGMAFQERKEQLKKLFERNHHEALIEEHFRITA